MPANRTRRRRHAKAGSPAELAAWETVFETGHDFFGELKPWGFATCAAARDGAPAAWARLGSQFLATHPKDPHREPWALVEFGPPDQLTRTN